MSLNELQMLYSSLCLDHSPAFQFHFTSVHLLHFNSSLIQSSKINSVFAHVTVQFSLLLPLVLFSGLSVLLYNVHRACSRSYINIIILYFLFSTSKFISAPCGPLSYAQCFHFTFTSVYTSESLHFNCLDYQFSLDLATSTAPFILFFFSS